MTSVNQLKAFDAKITSIRVFIRRLEGVMPIKGISDGIKISKINVINQKEFEQ